MLAIPAATPAAMIAYEGIASMGLPTRAVLALVEVASGELSIVAEFQQADGTLLSCPHWSPDGKPFVFVLDHFDGAEFLCGAPERAI